MDVTLVPSVVGGASDTPSRPPRIAGDLDGDDVLVPLLTEEVPTIRDQLRVAASLAAPSHAALHVANPIGISDRPPIQSRDELTAGDEQRLLEWAVEQVSTPASTGRRALSTHRLASNLVRAVRAADVDTLVVPSGSAVGQLRRGLVDRLARYADCDVITVNGRQGYGPVPSILLAVADGPHSGLATDVAGRIAADCDAWVDVLHVVDEDPSDDRRQRANARVEAAARRIDRSASTTTWVLEAGDAAEAIIEQSAYYGLTVVGAPTRGRLRRFIWGSTNRAIRSEARSVVISARNGR